MIDPVTLQKMDKKADKVITGYAFGALAANLLPPPFDLMAVGTLFGIMGGRLARVYGLKLNRATLKDLGVTIAGGIGAVFAAFYAAMGMAKWIPGVNFWISLFIQPPIVGAIGFAAGHAFKQYYHAILLEGRTLSAEEVVGNVKDALQEKLHLLQDAGYDFSTPLAPKNADLEQALESRPYHQRKFILLTSEPEEQAYLKMKNIKKPLLFIHPEGIKSIEFPANHPVERIVYVGHPFKPNIYYPAADFHLHLIDDKMIDLVRLLANLGASYYSITFVEGYNNTSLFSAKIDSIIGGKVNFNRSSDNSLAYEAHYEVRNPPRLPHELAWYNQEKWWQLIAHERISNNMRSFQLNFEYKDDYGVNAEFFAALQKLPKKIDIGGKVTAYRHTVFHIAGKFSDL